jgi:hypothetical protein
MSVKRSNAVEMRWKKKRVFCGTVRARKLRGRGNKKIQSSSVWRGLCIEIALFAANKNRKK